MTNELIKLNERLLDLYWNQEIDVPGELILGILFELERIKNDQK